MGRHYSNYIVNWGIHLPGKENRNFIAPLKLRSVIYGKYAKKICNPPG